METNKNDIRKMCLGRRKMLSFEERQEKSNLIAGYLYESREYKDAANVLIYADYNNEVVTDGIVDKAIKDGKRVYMPKVFGEDMKFYAIKCLEELEHGAFGIREPKENLELQFFEAPATICIMPLASFDLFGNRVGYGKGYYDRYLSRVSVQHRIGLAFSCQKVEEITADEFDQKLDFVITENGIERIGGLKYEY